MKPIWEKLNMPNNQQMFFNWTTNSSGEEVSTVDNMFKIIYYTSQGYNVVTYSNLPVSIPPKPVAAEEDSMED